VETSDTLFFDISTQTKRYENFKTCVLYEFDGVALPFIRTLHIMKKLGLVVNGANPNISHGLITGPPKDRSR
jgi:hypothetical protein